MSFFQDMVDLFDAVARAAKPVTDIVSAAAPAITVAGGLIAAKGALDAGKSADRRGNQQAALFEREARERREKGKLDAGDFRRRTSLAKADRRAELGASGAAFSGSVSEVDRDIAAEEEIQIARILSGASKSAATKEQEAGFARAVGRDAKSASKVRAATLIGSGFVDAFGT